MKKQSVEILDDATNFEQRMRWIMFQSENEEGLRNLKEGWFPGEPFYIHPWSRLGDEPQYVRWMAELMPDVDFWFPVMEDPSITYAPLEEGETLDDYDEPELIERVRCMECQVDWRGEEPCFVCDQVCIDPRPPYRAPKGLVWGDHIRAFTETQVRTPNEVRRLLGFETVSRGTHDGDAVFDLRMDPVDLDRVSQQMLVYAVAMTEELQPAVDRANAALLEFARGFMRNGEVQRYYITNRWMPANPPVSEGHIRVNGINLPGNVLEIIAHENLPVPQELLIELPNQETPPWQRPITEQRRRRNL